MATAKLFGQASLGITENDVVHSASKLFFAYGLGNAMSFPLSVGATAALWPHRPSPEGVFETLRRNRVTIFYGVPSLYTALLTHKDIVKGAGSDRLFGQVFFYLSFIMLAASAGLIATVTDFVHLSATKSTGTFPAGAYTAEVLVRCE